ncbi:iron-sulfur cluster assembly scaffold protein [Candidatus Micrarchaeota archaeon]|nr:iron-sulfur cluster assembly scaffold protein [Candidatus Micrarchaeota archaeon]
MNYSPQVLDHFRNPRNFGSLEKASGVGTVGNAVCGDVMKLYLIIEEDKEGKEIIKDIKFETFGCAAAIATSSMITQLVVGKTIKEALQIKNKDIAAELGQLPLSKMHCSVLAANALAEAVRDYREKKNKK